MGQKGFFDVERRLEAISAKGDPLETIKKIVPWEDFRTDIEAVTETKPEERKLASPRSISSLPSVSAFDQGALHLSRVVRLMVVGASTMRIANGTVGYPGPKLGPTPASQ